MFTNKFTRFFALIFFVIAIGLASCSGGTAMPGASPASPVATQAQPPSQPGETATAIEQIDIPLPTPEVPEMTTDVFGPQGGSLASANGLYILVIPPGALDRSYTFTMNSWRNKPSEEGFFAPPVEVLTDPVLQPVSVPMQLIYLGEVGDGEDVDFAVEYPLPVAQAVGGGLPPAIWIPLTQLFTNDDGHYFTHITHFTRFVVRQRPGGKVSVSIAPPIELNLPGFVPVGRFDLWSIFLVNLTYPKGRPITVSDVLVFFPQRGDREAAIHVFTPASPEPGELDQACDPLEHQLAPPDNQPIGYGYKGVAVTRNGAADPAVSSFSGDDDAFTWEQVQMSGTWNGATACKTEIVSYYVISQTITAAEAQRQGCMPSDAVMEPQAVFGSYTYQGVSVYINGLFVPDLSTVEVGTIFGPSSFSNTSTMSSGGGSCRVEVKHYYDVEQDDDDICGPSRDDWTVPSTPPGLTYVGREVSIQGEATIGLPDYFKYGDMWTHSYTVTKQIQPGTACTYQVSNYFRPTLQWSANVPDALYEPAHLPGFQLYATYYEVDNWMYSLTNYGGFDIADEESTYQEWLGWTPDGALFARHFTLDYFGAPVLFSAYDYYHPGITPPASFNFNTNGSLFDYSHEAYSEVYVTANALSSENAARLQSYSMRAVRMNDDGSFSVVLPAGTTLVQEDGVATFTVPGGN